MRSDRDWIHTYTGRRFWPLEPRAEDICIEDIAHHLAMKCRFTGATRRFYSVAEHCVRGSFLIEPWHALRFLLHDAHEAYLFDAATPVKDWLPEIRWIEDAIQLCVEERFGVECGLPEVKAVDLRMLATERRELIHTNGHQCVRCENVEPYPAYQSAGMGWPPDHAEKRFLDRFADLYVKRGAA